MDDLEAVLRRYLGEGGCGTRAQAIAEKETLSCICDLQHAERCCAAGGGSRMRCALQTAAPNKLVDDSMS